MCCHFMVQCQWPVPDQSVIFQPGQWSRLNVEGMKSLGVLYDFNPDEQFVHVRPRSRDTIGVMAA